MKVVCGYDPGKLGEKLFAAWEDEGGRFVVSPEEDDSFERELRVPELPLHILKPVTGEVLAAAARLGLVQKIRVSI